MLRKVLTCSILQQDDNAPLNASSRAKMVMGIGYPVPSDGLKSARDYRVGYISNSRAGTNNSMTGEPNDIGDDDQAD